MSKSVRVPHLGGIDVSYRLAKPYKQSKPTLVAITGLTWSIDGYTPQLKDETLTEAMNVLVIDGLGSGATNLKATETWTYWDSALMALQAMDAIGVKKAFVLGASTGGFVAARMALYSPSVILGLILTGTSLDSASQASLDNGNLDFSSQTVQILSQTSKSNESFEAPKEIGEGLVRAVVGESSNATELVQQWVDSFSKHYAGDAGRKKLRQTFINLRDRDTLYSRLSDITSPVLWIQGEQDKLFSAKSAQSEIKLLSGSSDAKLELLSGGHLLQLTSGEEFNKRVAEFASRYSDKPDARKLREAVGMIDI